MAGNSACNPQLLLSHKFPEATYTYTERDVAVYALGVGACGRDAVDTDELKYVHHENGLQFIKVLPTFSTLFTLNSLPRGADLPGLEFDPRLLLHGQQYIEIYKPLPSNATIQNKVSLAGLHDKGKAAILEIETRSYEKESGELLSMNRTSIFLRGAGGFSDPSKPFTYTNYPANQAPTIKIPESQPFAAFEDCTQPSQACSILALLYRLSGDYNPLHSDPMIAKVAGIQMNVEVQINERKSDIGVTLCRVLYRVKAKERNRAVLSGYVHLNGLASSL
ncbi:hypothetical protein COLO4_26053 [Corchorus olitorius]|uniref:Peroxisomal multifunctional enzyme type 2-like N-terminal domain-containing protein n=1 Tax=Corchorus olitorius TaxID=93759 RepID=A0A1R3HYT3_9ROSI|nr:hypothetical protein COLO4_26053 [Corchorus olitorius]